MKNTHSTHQDHRITLGMDHEIQDGETGPVVDYDDRARHGEWHGTNHNLVDEPCRPVNEKPDDSR